MTGVIFGAIVVVWLIILVPQYLGQHDQGSRLDERTLDEFADSMRVVRRSGQAEPGFLTDSGAQVSTPHTRRAAWRDLQVISRTAMRRRKIGLLVSLVLVVVGVVLPFVLPVSRWWTVLSVGVLVLWIVLSRISVVTIDRVLQAERDELAFGNDEMTVVVGARDETQSENVEEQTDTERSIDLTGPLVEALGSLWDPIPVTPTTYVSKPLLPRSVRTIDLSAPVASSELGVPVTAERPVQRDRDVEQEMPRAVGE